MNPIPLGCSFAGEYVGNIGAIRIFPEGEVKAWPAKFESKE